MGDITHEKEMGIFNLLADISTNYIDFAVEGIDPIKLNWIGKIIRWLIEGVSIVGLGIILFTLILKTIVLPLDIYSRYKMKKQSLLMKAMRPQMEKLQKQYANDKQMYNQKVMELQKANGISLFGACLPMIVSLVIFIAVFNAFSTYSQYANLQSYNNMVECYNASVEEFVHSDENEEGFLLRTTDEALGTDAYLVDFDKFLETARTVNWFSADEIEKFNSANEAGKMVEVRAFVRDNAGRTTAAYYKDNKNSFLWVKNIWYPDSLLNKEVPNFSNFSSAISKASVSSNYEESYNAVTQYLDKEQKTYNGYFILIVLAIGLMFLQQFISMRMQKDSNELSTVDGSGARTNKWMLIMMPLIYGIFSFFYSAAFSTYMITNTIYGLITMVILNKIMDVKFAQKEANGELLKKNNEKSINRKRLK